MHEAVSSASSHSKWSGDSTSENGSPPPPTPDIKLVEPGACFPASHDTQRRGCALRPFPPNAVDSAARGLADALRVFVRDALHQELTGLKDELLHAIRASHPPIPVRPRQTDASVRLLSCSWRLLSASGATPATIREWIKNGTSPPSPSVQPAASTAFDGVTSRQASRDARSGKSLWTPCRRGKRKSDPCFGSRSSHGTTWSVNVGSIYPAQEQALDPLQGRRRRVDAEQDALPSRGRGRGAQTPQASLRARSQRARRSRGADAGLADARALRSKVERGAFQARTRRLEERRGATQPPRASAPRLLAHRRDSSASPGRSLPEASRRRQARAEDDPEHLQRAHGAVSRRAARGPHRGVTLHPDEVPARRERRQESRVALHRDLHARRARDAHRG